jgi:hypothetical protein
MMKPQTPRSSSIWVLEASSVHVKAGGSAQHGISSNRLWHDVIERCQSYLKSCHKIVQGCRIILRPVSPQKKKIGVRDQGGHAIYPLCPIHLPGFVTFDHCRTISPLLRWSSIVLKKRPLSGSWRFVSSSLSGTASRRSRYQWAVRLSGRKYGPTTISPTIPAQTLILKQTWCPRLRIVWGLSRA